ncbi:hypothetical protein, partial [Legionella anisa]
KNLGTLPIAGEQNFYRTVVCLRRDDSLLNITVNYRIGFLFKFCEELSDFMRGIQRSTLPNHLR